MASEAAPIASADDVSRSVSNSRGASVDQDASDAADLANATSAHQMRDQLDLVANKHKLRGEEAASKEQWQQAVHEFTTALKFVLSGGEAEAAVLNQRSTALCRLSEYIRSIPARTSERRALFNHDPVHLAQLALKDAEKAALIKPTWSELYARQGNALSLLERYSDAESAYLEGLALQPTDVILKAGLQQVQDILAEQEAEQQQLLAEVRRTGMEGPTTAPAAPGQAGGPSPDHGGSRGADSLARSSSEAAAAKRQRRMAAPDHDDFECILCLKLLHEPVTTPCGHTFCRGCFSRSMDHSNKCPMCRTVLHVGRELPVTITLQNIISKAFPEEAEARVAEIRGLAATAAAPAAAEVVTLPLFVMSTLLPGEKMALNVFEPRYRLMVRRCMEGNRRFGMAQVGRTGPDGLDELAVEAEIIDCQPLPDGRYYLEMVGRRRLQVTRSWELDGYRMAAAEVLRDTAGSSGSSTGVAAASEGNLDGGSGLTTAAAAAGGSGRDSGEEDAVPGASDAGNQPDDAAAAAAAAAAGGGGGVSGQTLTELVDEVIDSCEVLMERLRSIMSSRRMGAGQIRELLDRLGDRPGKSDAEGISWWASRMLLLITPSNSEGWVRRELMALTDTKERLQMLQRGLQQRLGDSGAASCCIM